MMHRYAVGKKMSILKLSPLKIVYNKFVELYGKEEILDYICHTNNDILQGVIYIVRFKVILSKIFVNGKIMK